MTWRVFRTQYLFCTYTVVGIAASRKSAAARRRRIDSSGWGHTKFTVLDAVSPHRPASGIVLVTKASVGTRLEAVRRKVGEEAENELRRSVTRENPRAYLSTTHTTFHLPAPQQILAPHLKAPMYDGLHLETMLCKTLSIPKIGGFHHRQNGHRAF